MRSDESGELPIAEHEPVSAVAGYFPGLPPVPAPFGVSARVPSRLAERDMPPRTLGDH
jgi:hypothetical protein